MAPTTNSASHTSAPVDLWPGLVVTAAGIAVALAIAGLVPAVSALTVAVALGIATGNLPGLPEAVRPGMTWAMRRLLRLGVVLLGLRLAVGQVLGLGFGTIAAVLILVSVTFLGTLALGRLLGLSRGLSVLVGTGFAVCGASAIAAMESVVDRDDEDVATSIAMVTVFGTAAMLVLPVACAGLGLSDAQLGRIAGGSVHEVAQVVAAASPAGAAAVAVAVVVKLSRVVLLAPLVTVVSLVERRKHAVVGRRPPIMPLFVVGFLAAVALRSTGLLPEAVLAAAEQLTTLLLAGALFGLGASVRVPALIRTGPRALLLGLCSTVLVIATTFATMFTLV